MSLPKTQKGYSILELAIAMTLLSLGSAILWYTIKSASRMDRMNRLHHTALLAARSEMESLRLRPKANIHDTSMILTTSEGPSLVLIREVYDSAKIMTSLEDVVLDEKLSPQELQKPLEVKVQVLLRDPEENLGNLNDFSQDPKTGRALVTLILKIPEYRWY